MSQTRDSAATTVESAATTIDDSKVPANVDATKNDRGTKKPRSWKGTLIRSALAVLVLVTLRGFSIAHLLVGQYRWSSLLFDFAAGTVLFGILQISDALLAGLLKRLCGETRLSSKVFVATVRLTLVVLLFGTCLLATVQMHPPKIACLKTPADFGIQFTEHSVTTSDGIKIAVWAMSVADPQRPVVVVTHGLGANKQNFMFVSQLIHKLNYHVVTFDFRGHGDSGGHTCTLGVREAADVKAAFDFASTHFADRPIYAWSTSLGASATLRATAEHQIFDKMIIDATFSSVENLAMETKFNYLGWFAKPAWHISRLWYWVYVQKDIAQFAPVKDIAKIQQPICLIHGTNDKIIPHTESDRLLNAAAPGTQLWKVEGAGHSGSFHSADYGKRVTDFYEGRSASN